MKEFLIKEYDLPKEHSKKFGNVIDDILKLGKEADEYFKGNEKTSQINKK